MVKNKRRVFIKYYITASLNSILKMNIQLQYNIK